MKRIVIKKKTEEFTLGKNRKEIDINLDKYFIFFKCKIRKSSWK